MECGRPVLVLLGTVLAAGVAAGALPARPSATPALRVRVAGSAQVGRVLRATVRPAVRVRFQWQRCEWTGIHCRAVGRRSTYRMTGADLGRRLVARAFAGRRATSSAPTAIVVRRTGATIVAAGDIACDPAKAPVGPNQCRQVTTSDLAARPGASAILPLGDNQYDCGRAGEFSRGYARSWGRLRPLSHPVLGNHEYGTDCGANDPSPYFRFFGKAAGRVNKGWYSYDLGSWHLIALNSECRYGSGTSWAGGCAAGSPEETWLRRDLARHRNRCTLAYWHEPRFSSSQAGDAQAMAQIWNELVQAHVDVVLSGHGHVYERFDPLGAAPGQAETPGTPSFQQPAPDPSGIRQFVVGTGGRDHHAFPIVPMAGEVVRNGDTFGVATFTLRPGGYSWRFVPEPGKTFNDSGAATCH